MALDSHTREMLLSVFRTPEARDTVVAAIDSNGSGPAASIAALGTTSNLSAAVVTATTIADHTVTATTIAASDFTAAVAAEPTKAEIDAGIDTLKTAVVTALDLKADNTDLNSLKTSVVTALDLKADNADLETLRTQGEARLDAIETKLDALIAALKTAGMMTT